MKRDRIAFIAGFMPPLSMAFMLGFEWLVEKEVLGRAEYIVAAAEILPFLLPLLIIVLIGRLGGGEARGSARLGGFTRRAVPFVLLMSLSTALLSFLLNSGAALLFDRSPAPRLDYADSVGPAAAVLLVVLLPSIFEELFFRQGLLGAFEGHGTLAAIVVSAGAFALAHGSLDNLVGPFAAGLIYGYMAYTLGSIWPAIFAHMVNNSYALVMGYVTRTYETLGIWPHFLLATVFVFALLAWFSMRSLGRLIERGKIRRFRPGGLRGLVLGIVFAPGLWLLALMYIIKVAYL